MAVWFLTLIGAFWLVVSIMASPTSRDLDGLSIKEGFIPFSHPSLSSDVSAQIFYRVAGDLEGGSRPLVALHGGPGFSSLYLQPTLDLLSIKTGQPVVYFDQFGSGNSTHYREKRLDQGFWTIELFESQIETVLRHFDIADAFDLYGHSWGAMLAAHFAGLYKPAGLKQLILASGLASTKAAKESFNQLVSTLPDKIQEALRTAPPESDAYGEAIDLFYHRFVCRADPWPPELVETFARSEEDDTVYLTMWGPNELDVEGNLKSYDTSDLCKNINVPTLIISGEYDELQPVASRAWVDGISDREVVIVPNGSHLAGLEYPEIYVGHIASFLQQARHCDPSNQIELRV
ncbi:hypothetical protein NM208_g1105 [Fusarium decemcellulare]|uniref:Uncharacterized protein n=1 Tax=Fusarium decemcellulare TaxID=57161 RepID=A0ACC1SXD7_9HYPO|nr:hypothetical protein NM208_g1105 [Fusarium decemcellulare]